MTRTPATSTARAAAADPLTEVARGGVQAPDPEILAAHGIGAAVALRVLTYLASYWSRRAGATIALSQTTIADDLGLDRRTIRNALDALRAADLAVPTQTPTRGRRTAYGLPWWAPVASEAVPVVAPVALVPDLVPAVAETAPSTMAGTMARDMARVHAIPSELALDLNQHHQPEAVAVSAEPAPPALTDDEISQDDDPERAELVEWLTALNYQTGRHVAPTRDALAGARRCVALGITPAQAADQIRRDHPGIRTGGGIVYVLATLTAPQPTSRPPAASTVAEVLAPEICDDHGGWLVSNCPGCRPAAAGARA
jgi:hypothetical protein